MQLELAEPKIEDAELVHTWRQDPEALKASFHSKPETVEQFFLRYVRRYFADPGHPPLFITVDGVRVGFIGFYCKEVSVVIAKQHQRKGYALQALRKITAYARESLLAKIKPDNEGSIALFEKAGFRKSAEMTWEFRVPKKESQVEVIAEIGSNWKAGAFELIEAAARAGAHAAKFQLFQSHTTYAKNAGAADYLPGKQVDTLFDEYALPQEKVSELAAKCEEHGLEFLCSVFSIEEIEIVDPFVKRHKLASYELSHQPLIKALAKTKKPLLMSTGAATLDDVSEAVELFYESGGTELTLMQCTAAYPAAQLNLHTLQTYSEVFNLPVGLSDHSKDPTLAPLIATALGATVIEKHFTLSRDLEGPDHFFAVTEEELKELIKQVNAAKMLCGSGLKEILEEEKPLYGFAKRRLQATQDIDAGETLLLGENFAVLRPGTNTPGAHPREIERIHGTKVKTPLRAGEGVTLEIIEGDIF